MITIKKPTVSYEGGYATLSAQIEENAQVKTVWFRVEEQYGCYLTHERGDAFVIALLHYAMLRGEDICSEAPLSEELFYQLERVLIKSLADCSSVMQAISIHADTDNSSIRMGDAVGTGMSCGVDSFHVLASNLDERYPAHKITHLCFNNVGSHGSGSAAHELYLSRKKMARDFAEEFQFEFVENDSNLQDEFSQVHLFTHTYSSMFAVFCLQKLFKSYYYASTGFTLNTFSFDNAEYTDSGVYDLLLLQCFSSDSLRVYSAGCADTRFEKTKILVEYKPSHKYLNVCLHQIDNCSKCHKCRRTLLSLDALDKLDEYKDVFDLAVYKDDIDYNYAMLINETRESLNYLSPVYDVLKDRISLRIHLYAFYLRVWVVCKNILRDSLRKVVNPRLFGKVHAWYMSKKKRKVR